MRGVLDKNDRVFGQKSRIWIPEWAKSRQKRHVLQKCYDVISNLLEFREQKNIVVNQILREWTKSSESLDKIVMFEYF